MVMADIQGKDATILPIGKKAVEFFRARKLPALSEAYAEVADLSVGDCFSISKMLSNSYLNGEFDEVRIAYTKFQSVISQVPTTLQLLPLVLPENEEKAPYTSDIIYDPNNEEVFDAVVPEYVGGIVYGAICESRASEQAARRTAMDSATSNAEEMIADLSLKFNRARQAAITNELIDIVAGS
jgi:F-type H+-transporting ATPase subunit gamma